MPHTRNRFVLPAYRRLKAFWPVVGILGPRQCGKTTLLREFGELQSVTSLDGLAEREEARKSPSIFLSKRAEPAGLDEVQKAPEIFDAIKLAVDEDRRPGRFVLTGSTQFSAKAGVRESLTGRIGLLELFPMTLAELEAIPPKTAAGSRFSPAQVVKRAITGGMPVPAFARDEDQRSLYWRSWLDTTLMRDLPLVFRRGYDADVALAIIERMGAVFRDGELPTLKHFQFPARKVRSYFEAMETIYLVRRIRCHELGIGKECWIAADSGLAAYWMGSTSGEGATLSLIRHLLWNEWAATAEFAGRRFARVYYKSAQGHPVDLVADGVPYKIVATESAIGRQRAWEERALRGAMARLGSKRGFLVAPVERADIPASGEGIGVLPWGWWS